MTKEEARRRLGGILTEAVEFENSVCYVTEEDREPLEMAIKALEQEPCENAISRQAVLNTEYQVKIINDIEYVMLSEVQMKMRKLPSVNPQPKTGHWIVHEIESTLKWLECSNCHCETSYKRMYNYCPNCSAKMVESQESEEV